MNSTQLLQLARLEQSREEFEKSHTVPPNVVWTRDLNEYVATDLSYQANDEARTFNSMFFAFHAGTKSQIAQQQDSDLLLVGHIDRGLQDYPGKPIPMLNKHGHRLLDASGLYALPRFQKNLL